MMGCPYIPDLPYSDFRQRLRTRLGSERLPISGSIELNFRCNLRCQHCYVAHGHTGIPGKVELSYTEITRIIDELVDAGTLWLLLTGGELLMRRDFSDIYLYAKQKGLLVSLFTNATLLTPRIVNLLADYRPFNLEITLYGWTRETYEAVTGIPGSHKRCYQGIQRLVDAGIPFGLKTVLMVPNAHELPQMRLFAESLGVSFRFDPLINAGIEGCGKPLNVRLPARQVVEIEKQANLGPEWRKSLETYQDWQHNGDLYLCSAGVNSFHIDPYGQLAMCMMAREHTYDLRQGSFRQGWDEFLRLERTTLAGEDHGCSSCKLQPVCSSCPGWSFTEHGDSRSHVNYLCEVTHLRAETFGLNESFASSGSAQLFQIQFSTSTPQYQEILS